MRVGDFLARVLTFPNPRKSIMIESYWDLYVAYIAKCIRDNWANDVDPAHYEMEWNHFLPKCVFGDWPIGQWLTLKQHAIASAIQTLALNRVCLCPWHVKFLPAKLWSLCLPVYRLRQSEIGKQHVMSGHWKRCTALGGKARYEQKPESIKNLGRVWGQINVENGTLQRARERSAEVTSKPVRAFKDGVSLEFPSIVEASRQLNVVRANIHKCLRGERKRAGGYSWERL